MTLEQIGQLAVLWYEADDDWDRRIRGNRPHVHAAARRNRRARALRGAIRHYKLLEEAKGKGANDGTV